MGVGGFGEVFEARLGDGSGAPSLGGLRLDGSPVPLGSTATHDPITLPKGLWARWKPLEAATNNPKVPGITLQGQTEHAPRRVHICTAPLSHAASAASRIGSRTPLSVTPSVYNYCCYAALMGTEKPAERVHVQAEVVVHGPL